MCGRPRVLVTDADERSVLAAARSLDRAGYAVTTASPTRLAPGSWSRSAARRLRHADAGDDAERFVDGLRRELTARPYAALIPGSDGSLLAVSRLRERLAPLTALGLPPAAVVEAALDRSALAAAATRAGWAVAPARSCADPAAAREAARELGLPLVVKSAGAAASRGAGVRGAAKSRVVDSLAQLDTAVAQHGGVTLLQPRLDGDVISIGGVAAGGRLLGLAVARYRRTWPVRGGSVTFAETLAPPAGLEAAVVRLMAELGWQGIFELETIRTAAERFVPIDLNPRPYGSMALAARAGVPLAAIWCDWLLGSAPEPRRARAGCRYRWEDGELRHACWQARHGHPAAAAAALRPRRGVAHAHLQARDPLPLLARALHLSWRTLAGRRSGAPTRT